MTQSLELLLDDPADARIRAEWDGFVRADLPSQALHRGASNAPHVTLLARPALPPTAVEGLPLPIRLGSPVVLGGGDRRTIARLVVPTAELLSLHARLHAAVGPGEDAPFGAPGAWIPHVTLARRVPLADIGRALALVDGEVEATAVAIRHWDGVARRSRILTS